MNNIIRQTAVHALARLLSVALSFFLFAYIGRILSIEDAAKAYFFSFIIGFFLASSRMIVQLGARINSAGRLAQRFRCARQGFAIQIKILLPASIILGYYVWVNTNNAIIVLISLPIVVFAAFDIDLFRSIINKAAVFSASFLVGSILAVFLLIYVLPHSFESVIIALIAQWIPVACMNGRMALYSIRTFKIKILMDRPVYKVIILAAFDGLILNTPFFGFLNLSADVSFDLSLVIRVFVASLPMLPLIMHLANSPDFDKACQKFNINQDSAFGLALLLSGVFAGSVFLLVYSYVSDIKVAEKLFFMYLALLIAYVFYIMKARFSEVRSGSDVLYVIYGVVFVLYLCLLVLFSKNENWGSLGVLGIVGSQVFALFFAGLGLHSLGLKESK